MHRSALMGRPVALKAVCAFLTAIHAVVILDARQTIQFVAMIVLQQDAAKLDRYALATDSTHVVQHPTLLFALMPHIRVLQAAWSVDLLQQQKRTKC